MSDRIKNDWKVVQNIEIATGNYCVDIFKREDNSFGFEEFRRDSEDMGKWTAINYYSVLSYGSENEARRDAEDKIAWLKDIRQVKRAK